MKKIVAVIYLFLLVSLSVFAQVPPYVPIDGLVAFYLFNGNAHDESGNGNNGIVNGASLTTDRFGNPNQAYAFDGSSSYIQVPSTPMLCLSSAFSISAWANVAAFNAGGYPYQPAIVSKIQAGDWYEGYEVRALSSSTGIEKIFGTSGNIGGVNTPLFSGPSNINEWYFLAVTYDGTKIRFFINGICMDSASRSGSLQTSSIPLRFGRRGGSSNSLNCWFAGKIDDIGIWNRALTRDEIQFLYTGAPNYQATDLVFNEISTDKITFNWTDGSGTNRSVFIKRDSIGTASPVHNTSYMANTSFGSGSQIGISEWFCVFNGTTHDSGVTVTNLLPDTKYRVMICEYNGTPGNEQYNKSLATGNPENQKTCSIANPTISGSAIACQGITNTIYATEHNMTGYIWNISEGGEITAGAGTDSISVTWTAFGDQWVSVTYSSELGCTAPSPSVLNVTVDTTPDAAGTIAGPTTVFKGQTGVSYSVAAIPNANGYVWNLPSGATITSGANTANIVVSFSATATSGNMNVQGTNACGNGTVSPNLFITVAQAVPPTRTLTNLIVPGGQTSCYDATQTITVAGNGSVFLVLNNGSATFIAGEKVSFLPGVLVQEGGYAWAYITTTSGYCGSQSAPMVASLAGMDELIVQNSQNPSILNVYPNPTTGKLTLEITGSDENQKAVIQIFGMMGSLVMKEEMTGTARKEISLENHPSGVYLISVMAGDRMEMKKIVKL